jgi:effector-binding domain-containing protein
MTQEFGITELEAQPILGIRMTTKMDETISQVMGTLFGELMGYIGESGQAPAGMPLTIYHSMDETMQGSGEVDLECGIPVASATEGRGRIAAGELPAGKAATATHMGPYDDLGQTWMALRKWVESQGLEPACGAWEVYVTDPGAEPDQSKWRTDIFILVK